MSIQHTPSKVLHLSLWIAQIILALFLLSGTILKFMPIETISAMMPWTGQVPSALVRLLGILDLLGALGLILPSLLRIKPELTVWAAMGTLVLMLAATLFHVSRGETSVIGTNIVFAAIALFIAWGRLKKAPVAAKK